MMLVRFKSVKRLAENFACKTLEAIFAEPTKSNIAWTDIESLLVAVGCDIIEGAGSRVRFVHERDTFIAHRPHPQKETKQYVVRYVRGFLSEIGVKL